MLIYKNLFQTAKVTNSQPVKKKPVRKLQRHPSSQPATTTSKEVHSATVRKVRSGNTCATRKRMKSNNVR